MSVFDGQRLQPQLFQIDVERMRRGWYSDAYFFNTVAILERLAAEGYTFAGDSDLPDGQGAMLDTGNINVEMQFFTRREPFSLVAGVDEALAILQSSVGYFAPDGTFVSTYDQLQVEAVLDGTFANYSGNPLNVEPVLRVRGRYRDFALLETPILGALSEATRVATNVYNVLQATGGKDVLFFPARFAHYKLQALHGYAYSLAVQAYNQLHGTKSNVFVSTDDQAGWWGGKGGGTIAHSSIACFLGDVAETMVQFCRIMPLGVPRIALVDYHNDCIKDTLNVMRRMFGIYWELLLAGKRDEAAKFRLYGVRPDTSGNMRDRSIPPLGDKRLDCGVNPRLVWSLRQAMDQAYLSWGVAGEEELAAKSFCREAKIIVTGGFDVERIRLFEQLSVPVDIYGVGSSLLENSRAQSNDFTADIVRVKYQGKWYPLSKTGRQACANPNLRPV